jgi:hypothetical protein
MLPDRDDLKRILASLDVAIASEAKAHPDEDDLRTTLRASVRLLMIEASEAGHAWILEVQWSAHFTMCVEEWPSLIFATTDH